MSKPRKIPPATDSSDSEILPLPHECYLLLSAHHCREIRGLLETIRASVARIEFTLQQEGIPAVISGLEPEQG